MKIGDVKMPKTESIKEQFKRLSNNILLDEDDDENPNKYNRLTHLIKLLSQKRSEDFNSWINIAWCLINISSKEKITRRKTEDLIHQFSKLSPTNYDENKVDGWIAKNFDNVREKGFGWSYLIHTCIKEDNPKYYETLSKSYFNTKKEFELNNVKILYPPMIIHIDRNGENIIQPIPLCEKTNSHIKVFIKETNKKGEDIYEEKRFIDLWLDDPQIKKYEKYVFKPYPLKVEEYEFNTWTDFQITKTMVCIILYGEEGDGKNKLLDIFKNIIGDTYYTELENAKQLFGSHSCIKKENIFICVNEAKGKDNYENSETLKARITTNTIMVNPKGIQEFQISNF